MDGAIHPEMGTTDLGLAVFLMLNECHEGIPPWRVVSDGNKRQVEFLFVNVPCELIKQYRRDEGGFQRYNAIRRHMLRIIHTEIGD